MPILFRARGAVFFLLILGFGGARASDCPQFFTDPKVVAAELRQALFSKAKAKGGDKLPAFVRQGGSGPIPVILINSETYPLLRETFDNSIGMIVELENRGQDFDHGAVRVGTRLLDFYAPGTRYAVGDPHTTGILSRNVKVVLKRREDQFKNLSSDANPDGTPFRYVEMVYPVDAAEKEVADLYFRARQSAFWRVEYFWKRGQQKDKPHLLCRPEGAEHCLGLGAATQAQQHLWDIEHTLYHELGVKEEVPTWLNRPEVQEFQARARERLRDSGFSDEAPETWKAIDHTFLAKSDLYRYLEPVAAKNLSDAQKSKMMNYVLGHRLIGDYQKLVKRLDINEAKFLDWDNPKAGAVFIWEDTRAKEKFQKADYEFKGTVFSFPKDAKNEPLSSWKP